MVNDAIMHTRGESIVVITDALLVFPGWLWALLHTFDTHVAAAIVAPVIYDLDADHVLDAGHVLFADGAEQMHGQGAVWGPSLGMLVLVLVLVVLVLCSGGGGVWVGVWECMAHVHTRHSCPYTCTCVYTPPLQTPYTHHTIPHHTHTRHTTPHTATARPMDFVSLKSFAALRRPLLQVAVGSLIVDTALGDGRIAAADVALKLQRAGYEVGGVHGVGCCVEYGEKKRDGCVFVVLQGHTHTSTYIHISTPT